MNKVSNIRARVRARIKRLDQYNAELKDFHEAWKAKWEKFKEEEKKQANKSV